jgi:hypothetical protein
MQGRGPRLQEQMSPAPAPLHLLLLGKALADDGIHRRLDKGRGDTLTGSVALAIVDLAGLIAGDVDSELPYGRPGHHWISVVFSAETEPCYLFGSMLTRYRSAAFRSLSRLP